MPRTHKTAHASTSTRQASIGQFFVKRPGPAPPSVSKSRLPKSEPQPVEPEVILIEEEPLNEEEDEEEYSVDGEEEYSVDDEEASDEEDPAP